MERGGEGRGGSTEDKGLTWDEALATKLFHTFTLETLWFQRQLKLP